MEIALKPLDNSDSKSDNDNILIRRGEMAHSYDRIATESGICLDRRDDGRFVVYAVDDRAHQVYSLMPGDQPASPNGTGRWFARATSAGIDYVTSGYSQSYARRMYRRFVAEALAN